MRRPRPHRLTASVRRLPAAAVVAALGSVVVVTVVTASGPGVHLRSVGGVAVRGPSLPSLPVPTPSLPSLPVPTPPLPSLPLPSLPLPSLPLPSLPLQTPPIATPTPPVCVINCPTPSATPLPAPAGGTGRGNGPGSALGTNAIGQGAPGSQLASAAFSIVSPLQAPGGLSLSAPPSVEQLSPLAGLSFGHAPYLWPLFLILDVLAAAMVVLVVRKTWSSTPGAD